MEQQTISIAKAGIQASAPVQIATQAPSGCGLGGKGGLGTARKPFSSELDMFWQWTCDMYKVAPLALRIANPGLESSLVEMSTVGIECKCL